MRERNGSMGARIKPKDQSEGVEHWRIGALGRFENGEKNVYYHTVEKAFTWPVAS